MSLLSVNIENLLLYRKNQLIYVTFGTLKSGTFFLYRRVPVANVPGCTTACRLIVQPEILDVPTCTTRCPAGHTDDSDPSLEKMELLGEKWPVNLA
jgi:hypothetical protein